MRRAKTVSNSRSTRLWHSDECYAANIPKGRKALFEKLVAVNRVAKVVKGGRIFGFSALTVVGDGAGTGRHGPRQGARGAGRDPESDGERAPQHGGDCADEDYPAVPASSASTVRPRSTCNRRREGTGHYRRRPDACGIRSGRVQNVLAKCIGTTNPVNVVRATINGLQNMMASPEHMAAKRGKTVEEIRVRRLRYGHRTLGETLRVTKKSSLP